MKERIKRVRFAMPSKVLPILNPNESWHPMEMDTIFEGEIAGKIMVIEIPFDWMMKNLGKGPCKIFAAAAREKVSINRGHRRMPEPVEDLFYMFDHVCKFIDPVFDIDEGEASEIPMLLVSGETTFGGIA